MSNFKPVTVEIQVSGNKAVEAQQPKALLADADAAALINKLIYGTPLANDHVMHELEARYGAVMAHYYFSLMPKQ